MNEYPKIQGVYKREKFKNNKFIEGDWSLPEFDFLKNNIWVGSEKLDGMNTRVQYFPNVYTVYKILKSGPVLPHTPATKMTPSIEFKGKTDRAQIPAHLLKKLNEKFNDTKLFEDIFGDQEICLYGESVGKKIQSGGKYIKDDVDFILIDIKIGRWWLKRKDCEEIAEKLGIDIVPVIGEMSLLDWIELIKSKTLMSKWGNFLAEGVVVKPKIDLFSRNGERIITKIKHKDW